jgi:hypothetical protein
MDFRTNYFYLLIIFSTFLIIINACKPDNKVDTDHEKQSGEIDTTAMVLKYNSNLFIIPSPYQATNAIEKHDIEYNQDLINPVKNNERYTTNFKKALNLGIYGTDLGYLNLYNQKREIISYFKAVRSLADELSISNALEPRKMNRIKNQLIEQDSLIYLLTDTYKKFDSYLKQNNRNKIGALIVTGGWIESNYILSRIVQNNDNRFLINRLGEQKQPLDNLIDLLSGYYYESQKFTDLIDNLVELAYLYDGVIYNYYYKKPITREEDNLTVVRSESNVVISKYHLKSIAEKLTQIRNQIIS